MIAKHFVHIFLNSLKLSRWEVLLQLINFKGGNSLYYDLFLDFADVNIGVVYICHTLTL